MRRGVFYAPFFSALYVCATSLVYMSFRLVHEKIKSAVNLFLVSFGLVLTPFCFVCRKRFLDDMVIAVRDLDLSL